MAKDILPPFLLCTHTRTFMPLVRQVLSDGADLYKNGVLHVVEGEGDIDNFLQLLTDSDVRSQCGNTSENNNYYTSQAWQSKYDYSRLLYF